MKVTHSILVRLFVFCLLITTSITSCTQEDLLSNIIEDSISGENPDPDPDPDPEPVEDLVINTTPCEYTIENLAENTALAIECQIDLKGKSISIPAGVTLTFKGGEIINGTLNFASAGKIDGDLLNYKLVVTGNVSLVSETFQFHPSRWDIVQGKIDDGIASANTKTMEALFYKIKEIDGYEFKIDDFDAYFKTDGYLKDGSPSVLAINVPSDFHLSMSANTHLRMQPNGHFRASLIGIYDVENVKITGGFLHGERDEHNYNSGFIDSDGATGKTHEWLNTMTIRGGRDIHIDGVTFQDPAGDGLVISSIYHYFDSRHIRSKNITLKNNKFIRARRTNLVIVNAEYVYVENNEFIDGGIDTDRSKGTAPSSNFNMEPVRGKDATTGELIEYERVSHVYFRGNKQIVTDKVANPKAGGFYFSHGNGPIIVEDNEMINCGVSFTTVDGLIIRNNYIIGGSIAAGSADNFGRTDFVFGNQIYDNSVSSDGVALNISGNGVEAFDNILEGPVGIVIGAGAKTSDLGLSNTKIYNNTIKASSRGIASMNTIENVTIEGNILEMQKGANFSFALVNKWNKTENANFIIDNNTVTGFKSASLSGAPPSLIAGNYIEVANNKFGDIQINTGANNLIVKGNEIDANIGASGIRFYDDAPNSVFSNNKIILYTSNTPLKIEAIRVASSMKLTSVIENNEVIEK
tara:strand:+ start:3645 stop:5723 length:2079 start_codon:yes stop_codon:yes gene_type:complete